MSDDLAVESDQGNGRHALWIVATIGAGAHKMQLFAVPAAGGTPRQLTHDAANLFTPRVSPNGRLIAATRIAHRKQMWRMPQPR